jgi:predicted DCC family thiol-disulfide oxidoreductase YuxK
MGCESPSRHASSSAALSRTGTIPFMPDQPQHILIFDGDCDFCQDWAGWLALRDANTRKFRICPWQVVPSPPMTPLLQVQAQRAVQLITRDGRQLSGGRAALFALRETGWHPALIRLLERRPFVWGADLAYRIVAANRPRFDWLRPR